MKAARETLNEKLKLLLSRLNERQSLYLEMYRTYDIPISIIADICANRKDISEANDFIAFALLKSLSENSVTDYFTKDEIATYSTQKYVRQKISIPVVFENMVQVSMDQWIGRISAKRLMELKDAQLIKYNENTQRTLKRVVRGEDKYYKIFLNRKSVREIKAAFENGSYISDDITLNVPPDIIEFVTKRKPNGICDIVVNAPAIMDILDGYHRYIALSKVFQEQPDFDYPLELRICSFPEEKAKQFIYQKDQKTQMKKIDSESMNQYNPANTVVTNLNTNPGSNIRGLIAKSSQIDPAFLAAVIGSYYFKEKRIYSVKETLDVANDLQQKFNQLTTEDTAWLDHEYTEREIQIIIFCFVNNVSDNVTIRDMITAAEDISNIQFGLNNKGGVKQKLVNELTKKLSFVRREDSG